MEAITRVKAIGPVFRKVAIITESTKSTFGIDIYGITTKKLRSSENGKKTYPIITANKTKGTITLTAVFVLDDLLTSIIIHFHVWLRTIFYIEKT